MPTTPVDTPGLSTIARWTVAHRNELSWTGLMNIIQTARQAMVVADRRTSRRCTARCRAGDLTQVFRNVYVETSYLTNAPDRWELYRRVSAARACAVSLVLGPGAVICRESAALGLGIEMVSDLTPIHVCVTGIAVRTTEDLPALSVRPAGAQDEVVPAVSVVRHRMTLDPGWVVEAAPGVHVTDLVTTAVQCAQSMHPRESVPIVCGALRVLSRFDRFVRRIEASRERETQARTLLMGRLAELPARRNCKRAQAVIAAADAACESVAERILLWALKAAGFTDVRTQVHHRVGSNDYYVDFELPWCHIVVEVDGEAKYGMTVEDVHLAYDLQMRRQKDLESIGLVVVRFKRRELGRPGQVVAEVTRRSGLGTSPRPVTLLAA